MAVVQITYYTGANININAELAEKLPDRDIKILEFGSLLEFISWYTYSGCLWTLKFKVLCFYRRLKSHLWWNNRTLKVLFWITGLSFVFLAIGISFTCRPYSANWQIKPFPEPECVFRPQNFWITVVFNVLTDFAIMSIPLPIIWHLRASRMRKIGVSVLLLSGIFMISLAVIRAAKTLNGKPSVVNINRWGWREIIVGTVAVNAPVLAPIFTRAFWRKGSYRPFTPPDPGLRRLSTRKPPALESIVFGHYTDDPDEDHELSNFEGGKVVQAALGVGLSADE
ncbi:hypothetical protein HYFRA_00010726 [Hymenoscyphus fraxineus]|uniref:Rhodopsin domain-containing protein n=1 Tax=Hymenoscyphus fraxineus TaxID=746836 RepID=A0A9N9L320_9HELO|nr:hypothetical protein HYFRA_00010726 [Hymenoscyphus fraxineus]